MIFDRIREDSDDFSPLQDVSTFSCVDSQSFPIPSDNINTWCRNLPTGEDNAQSPAQSGLSSPGLSADTSSESQDILSQASDPLDTMVGANNVVEDMFSLSTDPNDAFGADQFLNLGDEIQTQAGSMDYTGSSVGPESLCNVSQPSPVVTMAPMHLQGHATHHAMPGFATGTTSVDNINMHYMVNSAPTSIPQHLPGCPSHRSGTHLQPTCYPQHITNHHTGQHTGNDSGYHTWSVSHPHGSLNHHHAQVTTTSFDNAHHLQSSIPQANQVTNERPDAHARSSISTNASTTNTYLNPASFQALPSPDSFSPHGVSQMSVHHAPLQSKPGHLTHISTDIQSEHGRDSPVSVIGSAVTPDNEGGPGRKSHLYSAQPNKADGMYHCYFEGQHECTHEPTKLKCNYDKYIDSHLKPYRCKQQGCEELRFSSTACRLRHEREAHGSHGHGVNPYLCIYEGCERAKRNRGFPRAWNRNDHMKRCHGHVPTAEEEQAASPTPVAKPDTPVNKDAAKSGSRKRVNKETENTPSTKRPKTQAKRGKHGTGTEQQESALEGLERQQRLHDEWRRRRLQLQQFVHELQGPNDAGALERVQGEVNAMASINRELAA